MRPIRLELSGFTAFREKSEVDFTRLDLFAITGPTGAGKTSLLDAITYALYGRTPRLSKAGRDLISQGATAMSVVFEFQVGAQNYRVARAIRGSSSSVRLEALEAGVWKSTAGRVTDANAEVQKLIGLDFGGFTKTVMLPQGQFDVFLRGDPKQRREVLAELLDVRIYGRMMASANTKAKDAGIRAEERERAIDASASVEAKAAAEAELEEIEKRRTEAEARGGVLRRALPIALALREKLRALEDNAGQRDRALADAARAREAIAGAVSAVESEARRVEEVSAELTAVAYDPDEHLALTALRPKAERLAQVQADLASEQNRWMKSGSQLAAAEKNLEAAQTAQDAAAADLQRAEAALRRSESEQSSLRAEFGSADKIRLLLDEITRAEAELPAMVREQEELRQLEWRAGNLDVEAGEAAAQLEQAKVKLRKFEDELEHLHTIHRGASLRMALVEGEPCPVCEQAVHRLPAPPDAAALTEAQARVKGGKAACDRATQKLGGIEAEAGQIPLRLAQKQESLTARQQRIASLESRIPAGGIAAAKPALLAAMDRSSAVDDAVLDARRQFEKARGEHGRSEAAVQQARHSREMVEADIRRSAQRVTALEEEREALAAELGDRTGVAAVSAQIAALEAALKQRRGLEDRLRQHQQRHRDAQQQAESKRQELAALEASLRVLETSLERQRGEAAELESALRELGAGADPSRIEELEAANRHETEALRLAKQRCEIRIADLQERIARNGLLREEVDSLRAGQALYHELGQWLNAGNFQQYLLKSAYQILTREGSRHLSHLSGGRYDFVFEDDEFAVADHANAGETRSVRTLSGGESFLASLALALALAESITQLNGDRGAINLESLFLDEGFSTLDPDTLGKVADALEVLHGGHRLVGIITHVPSLAEQMPARIEVVKGAGGSRIVQDADAPAVRSAAG